MQINATIQPSQMQRGVNVVAFLCVGLLCVQSDLSSEAKVIILMIIAGYAIFRWFLDRRRAVLIHLIQMDRQFWRWETKRHNANQAGQAVKEEGQLDRVHRVGWVMVLGFRVKPRAPHQAKPHNRSQTRSQIKYWLIWRDQVDADEWRRLRVLARFWIAVDTDAPRL